MDIKNIKKIIDLMKENELNEFELEEEGFRISIKRRNGDFHPMLSHAMPSPMMMHHAMGSAAAPAAKAEAEDEDEGLAPIKSPIVGTFYRAPSPDAEPFVTVGQQVQKDTTVCIIEAMKVMNEIKAEVSGTIRKILVENATAVQFDQPLFLVEPS